MLEGTQERDDASAPPTTAASRIGDTYRTTMHRVGGVMSLVYLLWLTPHWSTSLDLGLVGPALVLVSVGAHLLIAARGFSGWLDARDVALAALSTLSMLVLDLGTEPTGVGIQVSPAYPPLCLTLVIGFLVARRYYPLIVVLMYTLYVAARTLSGDSSSAWGAIDEFAADLGPIAVIAYTVGLYLRAGRQAGDAASAVALADTQHRAAEDRDRAAAARRRVLHDEVIGSLVAIQHSPDPVLTGEAASRALAALEEPLGSEAPAMVDLALTNTPLHLDVDEVLIDGLVPQSVRRAMTAAAAEAVRNADRHAEASLITVEARTLPNGATVSISDDGVGFDISGELGFGVRHSMVDRMDEVGGRVSLTSRPGAGTTVTISWEMNDDAIYSPPEAGSNRRFATIATLLASLGSVWLIARHGHGTDEIPIVLAAAALIVVAAALPGSRHVRTWEVLALGLGLAATTWWGLEAAGPGATNDFDAWIVTVVCVPIFTLACFVRYSDLVLMGTILSATVLTWTLRDGTSLSAAADAVSQPLFFAVAFGFTAAALRRARVAAAHAELDLLDSLRRDAVRATRSREIAEREAALRRELVPFLTDLRDGALTAGSTTVVDRARALALQVRDEIHLPGLLDDELRSLLASARQSGSTIAIRPSDESTGAAAPLPSLAPLLRGVIDPAVRQRITLTLPEEHHPYARLVVVPGVRSLDPVLRDRGDVDHSDEATIVTIADRR